MKCSLLFLVLLLIQTFAYDQHTGYISVNTEYNAKLFYWLFESQNQPNTDPLVLWLTGGPGCSSELAILFENGPILANTDGSGTLDNPYGWNKFANLLYVDQPAPTGFSTCTREYIGNEVQVVAEMLVFLSGFMAQYPQYASRDFYIVGESYGGHYVPAIAAGIVTATGKVRGQEYLLKYNLKAIAVGNGWVDPYVQFGSYGRYAYENKLITDTIWSSMNTTYIQCENDLQNKDWAAADRQCNSLMDTVLRHAGNLNVYNIKLPCIGSLCYDLKNIVTYLNTPQVQKNLGVNGITWKPCENTVGSAFYQDTLESYKVDIPTILSAGVRVVIYSGDLDLICNWMGGYQWSLSMQWPGQNELVNATAKTWLVNGVAAGNSISAQGFTFLRVFDAGHMVPHDKPEQALELLRKIISGQPF